MARVTVEDCLKKVNNRFLLVHLGAKRVIQLRKGAKCLVEAPKNKEVVLALREIAAGSLDLASLAQIEQDRLSEIRPEELPSASLPIEIPELTSPEGTSPESELEPDESKEASAEDAELDEPD